MNAPHTFAAWITPRDGITRRIALLSMDRADALAEARLLGLALYPRGGFRYSVRVAA